MITGTGEEIRIGQLAIRYLIEGQASGGSVAVFECDVPAGAKVPAARSHDAYEETIYGLAGVLTSEIWHSRSFWPRCYRSSSSVASLIFTSEIAEDV
jgi:hypothetical protein